MCRHLLSFIITYFVATYACFANDSINYDFINTQANQIIMNNADWSSLKETAITLINRQNISAEHPVKLSILQIGDSHIQAGIMSEEIRSALQNTYGNGGRGCIAPLRLIATNQPTDYSITASAKVLQKTQATRRSKHKINVGITGVAATFRTSTIELSITTKHEDDQFSQVTLLHAPGNGYKKAKVNGETLTDTTQTSYSSTFTLSKPTNSITLGNINADSEFWGAYVTNNHHGVIFNSIGNNGACYSHYNKIANFAEQTTLMQPQLIIISLGTNEAFAKFSDDELYNHINALVTELKKHNPNAQFLLTTPMECDRRTRYRYRGRRRYKFATNTNCLRVRDAIVNYGTKHNIAVWDLYTIAGGEGAAKLWVSNALLAKRDHIHCSAAGYQLQGKLLAKALISAIESQNASGQDLENQH